MSAGRRKKDDRIIRLAGRLADGEPIDRSIRLSVRIPAETIEDHEEVYEVGASGNAASNIQEGDLLILEPRRDGRAATAELVLVEHEGRAYLGRWWKKHGRRAVYDDVHDLVIEGPRIQVLGAVTMVVRWGMQ